MLRKLGLDRLHSLKGSMEREGRTRAFGILLVVMSILTGARASAQLCTGPGAGTEPFAFLQAGFSQELFATAPIGYPSIAFAPDGDLWAGIGPYFAEPLLPSLLVRFSATTTSIVNGTVVHSPVPGSPFASANGLGLTNGFLHTLYSNTIAGVVRLDPETATLLAGPFGPAGSGLGIATDPQTGNLVYAGLSSALLFVDAAFTTSGVFSTATAGSFVDGIYFDPTGRFLFAAVGTPVAGLAVLDRHGNLVQVIPNPGGGLPGAFCVGTDGVAVHENPTFVVSVNRDGTMTRYDFPNDDFTQAPIVSVFASGGFRGDFAQVGSDRCLYVTQLGTRFRDATVSLDPSVARVCPDFSQPLEEVPGRMTGGGSVIGSGGVRLTHGFEIHCTPAQAPNHLEVHGKEGARFHLESLEAAVCFRDAAFDSARPSADFNTLVGKGRGGYNGRSGASIQFTFRDAGEPGTEDFADLVVTDSNGSVVLSAAGELRSGDHQAHAN